MLHHLAPSPCTPCPPPFSQIPPLCEAGDNYLKESEIFSFLSFPALFEAKMIYGVYRFKDFFFVSLCPQKFNSYKYLYSY
jgi:hypothetical protein